VLLATNRNAASWFMPGSRQSILPPCYRIGQHQQHQQQQRRRRRRRWTSPSLTKCKGTATQAVADEGFDDKNSSTSTTASTARILLVVPLPHPPRLIGRKAIMGWKQRALSAMTTPVSPASFRCWSWLPPLEASYSGNNDKTNDWRRRRLRLDPVDITGKVVAIRSFGNDSKRITRMHPHNCPKPNSPRSRVVTQHTNQIVEKCKQKQKKRELFWSFEKPYNAISNFFSNQRLYNNNNIDGYLSLCYYVERRKTMENFGRKMLEERKFLLICCGIPGLPHT